MQIPKFFQLKNISAKEMSVLAPVIFNKLNSVRIHLEAVLEDIKELQSAVADMVDPDGEVSNATFRTGTEQQINISGVVDNINVNDNTNDPSRGGGDITISTPKL